MHGFAGKVLGGPALHLKIYARSHKGGHTIEEFKILLPNSTPFVLPDACQTLSVYVVYIQVVKNLISFSLMMTLK